MAETTITNALAHATPIEQDISATRIRVLIGNCVTYRKNRIVKAQ